MPEPTVRIKSEDLELISLEIAPKHAKSFLVVCWYRPPTADDAAFDNLREVLKILKVDCKDIILIGDTNYDFINKLNSKAKKIKCSLF